MQFIPGFNKSEVLEHRSPGGDKMLHPLECCGDFECDQAVAEPLQPGGCTVHDARTLHFRAPIRRRPWLAYSLIYNTPPVYKLGRREFPWLEGRWTDRQTRKKEWHRHGGLAVDVLRRAALAGGAPDQPALGGMGDDSRGQQGLAALAAGSVAVSAATRKRSR